MSISDRSTYQTTKSRIEEIVIQWGDCPELCTQKIMGVVCTYHVPFDWWTELKGASKQAELPDDPPNERGLR